LDYLPTKIDGASNVANQSALQIHSEALEFLREHREHIAKGGVEELLSYAVQRNHRASVGCFLGLLSTYKHHIKDFDSILLWAVEHNYRDIVGMLFTLDNRKPVDSYAAQILYLTPLHRAVCFGNYATVEQLLLARRHRDIDLGDLGNELLLTAASARGLYGRMRGSLELLLKTEGVDINYGDSEKRTPLILASQGGREDIVQGLLKYPLIEINSLDLLGETAFIKAVSIGHGRIVRQLLDTQKIDINFVDSKKRTPLMLACQGGWEGVVKTLLSPPLVEINYQDRLGETAFTKVIKIGHVDIARRLLNTRKVDINLRDRASKTALIWAVERRLGAIVEILLASTQLDIDSKDQKGQTQISAALSINNVDPTIELLLRKYLS
jgi:ankyrin repeat protein